MIRRPSDLSAAVIAAAADAEQPAAIEAAAGAARPAAITVSARAARPIILAPELLEALAESRRDDHGGGEVCRGGDHSGRGARDHR